MKLNFQIKKNYNFISLHYLLVCTSKLLPLSNVPGSVTVHHPPTLNHHTDCMSTVQESHVNKCTLCPTGAGICLDSPVCGNPGAFQLGSGSLGGLQEEGVGDEEE